MNQSVSFSGMEQRVASVLFRTTVVVLVGYFLCLTSASAFGDDTVGERGIAFEYLDRVEQAVGFAEFDSISATLSSQLALSLGRLDRNWLMPEAFVHHVRQVEVARLRFYKQRKLSEDEVGAFLLPYRIRNELSSKSDWMELMAKHFSPVTQKAGTADEAAQAIFEWTAIHAKLLDPALSYTLPMRGDLDPLTVLKGGYGNEIDCAIFGVAALRASGVAARFVWAPALRGEKGGKAWLEYLSETGNWHPWVPSFGSIPDHAEKLRERIGAKILFVMAQPEAPVEVTHAYVETVEVTVQSSDESLEVQLLAAGQDHLLHARGNEGERNERNFTIGAGGFVIAASFGMRSFALLPVECAPHQKAIHITADSGRLAVTQSPK